MHYVRQSRHISLAKSKSKTEATGAEQPSFVFVGVDLEEGALKAWLSSCRAKPKEPLPLRTRRSLTKAELASIVKPVSDRHCTS